jgi:prepilin-type N-terminal cleavage/methylation domain-containing protein
MRRAFPSKSRKGFMLVELSVVIVIIGVLAAFGVPRLLRSVERSKAAEAFSYLSAVRSAQERFQALNGTYANDMSLLDFQLPAPTYFTSPSGTAINSRTPPSPTDWLSAV